ncbi:MAG: hypothetical protein II310_07890, partial [Selenomonadaceae bacterium]|nr:hypothetical protein [Selenomonadaceae bacterium]
ALPVQPDQVVKGLDCACFYGIDVNQYPKNVKILPKYEILFNAYSNLLNFANIFHSSNRLHFTAYWQKSKEQKLKNMPIR